MTTEWHWMEPDASGARYGVSFDTRTDAARFIIVRADESRTVRELVGKGLIEWHSRALIAKPGSDTFEMTSGVEVLCDDGPPSSLPQPVFDFLVRQWMLMRKRIFAEKGS